MIRAFLKKFLDESDARNDGPAKQPPALPPTLPSPSFHEVERLKNELNMLSKQLDAEKTKSNKMQTTLQLIKEGINCRVLSGTRTNSEWCWQHSDGRWSATITGMFKNGKLRSADLVAYQKVKKSL